MYHERCEMVLKHHPPFEQWHLKDCCKIWERFISDGTSYYMAVQFEVLLEGYLTGSMRNYTFCFIFLFHITFYSFIIQERTVFKELLFGFLLNSVRSWNEVTIRLEIINRTAFITSFQKIISCDDPKVHLATSWSSLKVKFHFCSYFALQLNKWNHFNGFSRS